MSSAISTDVDTSTGSAGSGTAAFRPWHFFLLGSLALATVAVMMSREATAEHLVFMSLTIVAAGIAAAGFYRMLAPFAAKDDGRFAISLSERKRTAIEREKRLVLRSIKELEFDRAMGKVSPKDFDEMAARLRTRALTLIKQLDEETGYRQIIEGELQSRLGVERQPAARARAAAAPPVGTCAGCGTANDVDATFCKRCGSRLEVPA